MMQDRVYSKFELAEIRLARDIYLFNYEQDLWVVIPKAKA